MLHRTVTCLKRSVCVSGLYVCSLVLSFLSAQSACSEVLRVACVGDSVTYGKTIEDRTKDSYPAQLQRQLGTGFDVKNYGVNGATLLRKGHHPYSSTDELKSAKSFHADIVVIHLGLNDTDPRDWPGYRDDFAADYSWLIAQFREANPKAHIYVGVLTPIFPPHSRFKSGTRVWAQEIRDEIPGIAKANHVELIDLYTPLHARPDLFADAVHPDADGASILAHSVYEAITGDFGGLRLEEGYGDHMVLPHGEALHLRGKANRGEAVTLEFARKRWHTTADANGDWSVAIPEQKPGGPYVLSFRTASRTVELRDVFFGELWLASGQSNMDFPVSRSSEVNEAMQMANQPMIRLLHYKNVAPTDKLAWNQETLKAVNQLHYFSGRWETLNGDNAADFSAVAYFFAQKLHQKLGVPIGIVQVSVGGSGAESWISRRTIEDDPQLVDMLVKWRDSDFIMLWCRERAAENLAAAKNPLQQHPYEPSYNFEAGIAPILHLPIKGVIWYQGESNTENLELYEHLFPALVRDWRQRWGRDLPFYFVQLSGLNRPSWPRFRDAQRRLAETIPNSGMVVSSDLGEEDEVHYHRKRAIGERLADLALERLYRIAGVHGESPVGFKASRSGKELRIQFKNNDGRLQTSDGLAARGFELRDGKGNWHPVAAQIEGNTVVVKESAFDDVDAVAYAWQPFPHANLVNSYGLPASTFLLEVPR